MKFCETIRLKTGETCILRSAEPEDAQNYLALFRKTHQESDFLTTYPDESRRTADEYGRMLRELSEDPKALELCAFVDGNMVGTAGFSVVRDRDKVRHRAAYGISILKEYCGKGQGTRMTEVCIRCAREAGYLQMELEVVEDNAAAIAVYRKCGFEAYGRNPRGFLTRDGRWQTLIEMRLELDR